ncbi:Putative conjugal transfer protein [Mycobacterium talmoniae]|uniref:Conjugal transfer protein n=1 Tax=Mycobacterium talmoniae TaxID=1858794 RepID=A0A2S8BCL3_9MYCO|nr:Putative conjugal transfer protein [Mycobacterium talmoniae]
MCVEDAAELAPPHPHLVKLVARRANVEGVGEVTVRELVRQALRMRPDRIVVGEVRGAEVVDLLAALNTGHDGGAGTVHANGFIAAYLAAVVLANSGLPHRSATRSFAEGLGWLAQIGLFVLLGLLVSPGDLSGELIPAVVAGAVLLLLGRPLSVLISLAGFRVPWREQVFLSWAGLRGAVPIVLATFPIVAGVPDSFRLLNIVFILVVVFTLVQGPSLGLIAHVMRLIPRDTTREIHVESAPLDVLEAELLTMTVLPASRLNNVSVLELRLPDPSVITLIIRDGHTFVPQPDTRIAVGDELLIVTTSKTRVATERRLRAVSRRGKLAYWFDEYGEPD